MKMKMYLFKCFLLLCVLLSFSVAKAQTTILTVNGVVTIDNGSTYVIGAGQRVVVNDNSRFHIRQGGKLVFQEGASLVLNGNNAILDIDGWLDIADNAHFTFTGSGFVRFGPYFGAYYLSGLVTGINSTMTFAGSGKNDKVLELNQSIYASGDEGRKFNITNGRMDLSSNAALELWGEFHITNATIVGGDGIRARSYAISEINGCTFNSNKICIETNLDPYMIQSNYVPIAISNCEFNSPLLYAVKVHNGGFTMNNCYINYTSTGILATSVTHPSSISGVTIDYVENDGINYTAATNVTAPLSVTNLNLDDAQRGVVVANADLRLLCSYISTITDKAVSVTNGALNMAPSLVQSGYNHLSVIGGSSNSAVIYLDQATGLSLDYGRNVFSKEAACPYFIYSTTILPGITTSFNVRGNNWHSPIGSAFLATPSQSYFRIPNSPTMNLATAVTSPVTGYNEYVNPCGASTQAPALGIQSQSAAVTSAMTITPNPAADQAVISFTLAQDEHLRLEITDAWGKTWYTIESKAYTAGDNQVLLDAKPLSTGTYIVRLIGTRTSLSNKLLIVR